MFRRMNVIDWSKGMCIQKVHKFNSKSYLFFLLLEHKMDVGTHTKKRRLKKSGTCVQCNRQRKNNNNNNDKEEHKH